ncbi:hypothetical protein MBLNU457_1412t2 [Dothideomycetes sp. NU457]
MASSTARHLASPTVLTGNDGTPVVPTIVPPTIEFKTGVSRPPSSKSAGEASADDNDSYFDATAATKQPAEPATVNDASFSVSKPSQPHPTLRAGTAPMGGLRPSIQPQFNSDRPGAPRRGASLGNGLGRKNTATAIDDGRAPYSYQFDPPSDSDSSSSDDEGQKAKRPKQDTTKQAETSKGRGKRKAMDRGRSYNKFNVSNDQFNSKGRVSKKDGRLNISINETANNGYIAKALGQGLKHHLDVPDRHGRHPASDKQDQQPEIDSKEAQGIIDTLRKTVPRPNLNIVIMVVGSRGDIQPFLKVGKILQERGHRVRIATHPAFREFVQKDIGLEFFSIGGDPSELMAFMVKNPGLIPSLDTIKEGEIQKKRNQMAEMFEGFWRACVNATDDEHDKFNMKMMGDRAPFVANAIIANPPSFAHVHIAERLGIPLHIMFTFPYSPTQQFPHPLANIKPSKSNVDANYANFMSYPLVEMMTWQGLGDIVNKFRVKTLGLEPVSSLWAPGALYRMKVPYTYMWSSELIPKPKDWGPEIDISGFVFLDLASKFEPPEELQKFLDNGEPPVYIGFGSIVVDDPEKFTQLIFDAVKKAGVRALVSKGWGGIGGGDVPDNILLLGNTPHDWLFPKCSAVVHHGGAGTTAIGLKCGKPTMIVPFFGDQPFWGAMVSSNKAGAHQAVPYKNLTVDRLAEGIKQCLTQEAKDNTARIADSIAHEGDGAENAVKSFERSLPLAGHYNMRCSMLEDRAAVWRLKHSNLRLSALAADILVEEKKIKWKDLRLLRTYEWNDFDGPGMASGVGMIPVRMEKHIRKRDEHERKKKEAQEKRAEKKRKKIGAVEEKAENEGQTAPLTEGSTPSNERSARRPQPQQQATGMTQTTNMSVDPEEPLAQELGRDAGEGLLETGEALISAPLDLTLAIAQGFHNAPRLYGDASVRKPMRITGFHSGLKAAGRELVFGVYDGFSGLVLQPVGGWKDASGVTGHITGVSKGFARGIGGFVLKDISAIITPPAFVAQGVRREVKKRMAGPGSGSDMWIRRAHIIQGQKDARSLQGKSSGNGSLQEAQKLVDKGWRIMEETWDVAYHHRRTGGPIKGRLGLFREKKKWEEAGALENISATERALKARKEGKDLNRVFRQTQKEMDLADQPRASALQQPHAYEANPDVLPNGQVGHSAAAKDKPRDVRQRSDTGTAYSHDSDSTKVDSPDRTASAAADGKTHERYGSAASKFDTGMDRQGAQMTGQRPLGVSA